jgi:pimeloyl-ACP methyl ester carboxylesterase
MISGPVRARTALALLCALLAVFAVAAAPAAAKHSKPKPAPAVDWEECEDAPDFDCATYAVPRDYDRPKGDTLDLAVTRLPATGTPSQRIGSLFVNFGGPGGDAVSSLHDFGAGLFATLNDRFDIVGFDPRGTGATEGAIDCAVNQETEGVYRQPFLTPENIDVGDWIGDSFRIANRCASLNRDILPYVSTANVARDMDRLREAVGDNRLNYLGFSYGTQLGATYASLFPHRYRALVLDGAVDPDQYMNRPVEGLFEQSAGFERAFGRFFQACAADQEACLGFGGEDPWGAYDELVERLDENPQPASPTDPRLVDGDDARAGAVVAIYAKQNWPFLAAALASAEAGDYELLRLLADFFYGRLDDGTYDPLTDRYYTLGAAEQDYPSSIRFYLRSGRHAWGMFDHAWWNTGYTDLAWGVFPVRARDTFDGPFRAKGSAPATLVVGTTYDPATPYRGAKRMVAQLGNARLLTMRGDGHTAYGGNSPCIDAAVDAYLEQGTLPPAGTKCRQEVEFEQALAARSTQRQLLRPHVRPLR